MIKVDLNKQFRKLPYAMVDLAISQGWTKELSYYLHITSLFGNGIIYNYSTRTLSEKLGVSKSAVHKNVSYLLEAGLLRLDSGNLIGLPLKSLRSWYIGQTGEETGTGLLTIKLHDTLKYTEWNLLARVPLNGINKQKYLSTKRAEVNAIRARVNGGGFISSSDYKKLNKAESSLGTKHTENANKSFTSGVYFMSDKFLVKGTGKSISTVRSMVKFWVSQGLISSTFHKGGCLETHVTARSFEALTYERSSDFSNTYLYKGRIMQFNKRSLTYGDSTRVYKEQYSN